MRSFVLGDEVRTCWKVVLVIWIENACLRTDFDQRRNCISRVIVIGGNASWESHQVIAIWNGFDRLRRFLLENRLQMNVVLVKIATDLLCFHTILFTHDVRCFVLRLLNTTEVEVEFLGKEFLVDIRQWPVSLSTYDSVSERINVDVRKGFGEQHTCEYAPFLLVFPTMTRFVLPLRWASGFPFDQRNPLTMRLKSRLWSSVVRE